MTKAKDIITAGSALAGASTAMRLAHNASTPLNITMIEQNESSRNGGIAYSQDSAAPWHYLFNIHAGRLGVYREDPYDFVNWANLEADRTGWHSHWYHLFFRISGSAPRRLYQPYIETRLADAEKQMIAGSTMQRITGQVFDLIDHGHYGELFVGTENDHQIIKADKIVLATGHEEKEPDSPSVIHANGNVIIKRPYSTDGRIALATIPTGETVVIKGNFLTSWDVTLTLLQQNHTGRIVQACRSGYYPWGYPKDYEHTVADVPAPRFATEEDLPIDRRIALAHAEFDKVLDNNYRPKTPEEFVEEEQTLKAWEPHIGRVMKKLPDKDARRFMKEVLVKWSRFRVGVMPEVYQRIFGAMTKPYDEQDYPQVMHHKDLDELGLGWHGNPRYYVDPIERETDYSKVQNPLWRNLIDKRKSAVPHRKTGRGVEIGPAGELMDAQGRLSSVVSVVGIPAEGAEIVIGRVPPFSFNAAAIKDMSTRTAAAILGNIEWGRQADKPLCTVPAKLYDPFNELMHAYIKRIGTKIRAEKENIDQEISTGPLSVIRQHFAKQATPAETVDEITYAAWRQAWNKFTDRSVTPKALRAQLGLER